MGLFGAMGKGAVGALPSCRMGPAQVRSPLRPGSPAVLTARHKYADRTLTPIVAPSRSFRLGRQEDSHEFLRCLLDGMHEACLRRFKPNKPPPELAHTTFVYRIFGGRLRSQVGASGCRANSVWGWRLGARLGAACAARCARVRRHWFGVGAREGGACAAR